MKRIFLIALLLTCTTIIHAQNGWTWETLSSMPEAVSNNAVSQGYSGDTLCVFSFTGISTGLAPSDIHLKSWRYNTILDSWQQLPDVDDTMGKIAAAASTVKNKIYVIGGYHVLSNFNEVTSAKVHRFDPEINQWLENGADAPVAIDDHVQVVWRDSLIYTVTGWSTNTNITDVQIYNPALDTWSAATSVPTSNTFRAFGASGVILGDTIYYYGGTQISGINFVANNNIRKGVINPANPAEITWELLPDTEFENGYRVAGFNYGNSAVWIGGAATAYNFDGLAYSNGAGVEPETVIRIYDTESHSTQVLAPTPFAVMDLRGIASESSNAWIIAGGMGANQVVSAATYRITAPVTGIKAIQDLPFKITQDGSEYTLRFEKIVNGKLAVLNAIGQQITVQNISGNTLTINLEAESSGLYLFNIYTETGQKTTAKVWNP